MEENIRILKSMKHLQYRATLLNNDQSPTTVAQPVAIAVDSDRGLLFWLDRGAGAAPPKVAIILRI